MRQEADQECEFQYEANGSHVAYYYTIPDNDKREMLTSLKTRQLFKRFLIGKVELQTFCEKN